MSEFCIEREQFLYGQQAVAVCGEKIGNIAVSLGSVNVGSCGYSLRRSLELVRDEVADEAGAIGRAAETLGTVLNLYTETETMSDVSAFNLNAHDVFVQQYVPENDATADTAATENKENTDIESSMLHGLFGYGIATLGTILENYVTDIGAEAAADAICAFMRRSLPTLFMDRGMVLALAGGGEALLAETPSWLASVVRAGSKWLVPVIGTAIDFGIQRWQGEEAGDAAIKAGAHTIIGFGAQAGGAAIGAKIGGIIGSAVPGAGTAIGIAAGAVIGAAGSVAFDFVYDNWDDITGWAGDRLEEAGNWLGDRAEDFGNWVNDTGAAIGNFFGGLGNAFSFSW